MERINTNTHIHHSKRLSTERRNSIDRCHSCLKQVFFFFLVCRLNKWQPEGGREETAYYSLCIMLFQAWAADQSTCTYFAKICRSGSQEIPRLLRYPLSCSSSSLHVRNVRHTKPVHTLPLILFKIHRNLYTPIYAQVFQVLSSLQRLYPKLCMNAGMGT
jgi:hypothetical protein